ncbi:MAG: endolytic transglycosylase MltG [Actinobacteria bacterium]|nr:endolytic transglycosylase MltG [Actinomycetota bacterium]
MSLTRRGRIVTVLGFLGVLFGGVALGGYMYLRSLGVYGSSDPGKLVTVTIPQGASASEVGEILEDKGVIRSAQGFRIASYLEGGFDQIQAGEYQLPRGLIAKDALAALTEGDGPKGEEFVTVTFPEGLWLTEFAERVEDDAGLSAERFLKVLESGKVDTPLVPESGDMEGLLFPSTYNFGISEDEVSVAQKMADEMTSRVERFTADSAVNLSPYEFVIVASMIEAETRVDTERAMVARVIYNRLAEDIPLGIDATFLYALGERKGALTQSDLAIDSPYNSRENLGLPPTPIGAPGEASLRAAAKPAEGPWLYYVLGDCEGNHKFSESYDEFLVNKDAYLSLEC